MTTSRRFQVFGKVQGVWFRESTRRQALRLAIDGHAINLSDGSVEVVAKGSGDQLDQLHQWLLQGPPLAEVSRVEHHDYNEPIGAGFVTG
ncbi:MAG: acylphosphatase [Xanthomonadales bacterium]|nr:acylphosphatase [Xanthomonadales bacterium]